MSERPERLAGWLVLAGLAVLVVAPLGVPALVMFLRGLRARREGNTYRYLMEVSAAKRWTLTTVVGVLLAVALVSLVLCTISLPWRDDSGYHDG